MEDDLVLEDDLVVKDDLVVGDDLVVQGDLNVEEKTSSTFCEEIAGVRLSEAGRQLLESEFKHHRCGGTADLVSEVVTLQDGCGTCIEVLGLALYLCGEYGSV